MLVISNTSMLLSMPSGTEWLWVVLIAVLLFGGRKIPELARGIGKGIREFNDAKDGLKKEMETGMKDGANKPTTTPEEK